MLKAIFWDNDGVLVDTEGLYYQANRKILAETGIELTPDDYRRISLNNGQSVLNEAARNGYTRQQIAELRLRRDEVYVQLISQGVRIFSGARETLEHFRGRVLMGLVTSSPRKYFDAVHAQTGLVSLVRNHYIDR